jgi:hypothetical protein
MAKNTAERRSSEAVFKTKHQRIIAKNISQSSDDWEIFPGTKVPQLMPRCLREHLAKTHNQ